jgi:hypothetical protein
LQDLEQFAIDGVADQIRGAALRIFPDFERSGSNLCTR